MKSRFLSMLSLPVWRLHPNLEPQSEPSIPSPMLTWVMLRAGVIVDTIVFDFPVAEWWYDPALKSNSKTKKKKEERNKKRDANSCKAVCDMSNILLSNVNLSRSVRYVGYLRKFSPTSPLSWIRESRALFANPLTLPPTDVSISIRDAVSFSNESSFFNLSYTVFAQPDSAAEVCSCLGSNTCLCNASATVVGVGQVGPDLTPCSSTDCALDSDAEWLSLFANALFLAPGHYRVVFSLTRYIDAYLVLVVSTFSSRITVTMVPVVPPNSLRAGEPAIRNRPTRVLCDAPYCHRV